jgi:hypothetical protein
MTGSHPPIHPGTGTDRASPLRAGSTRTQPRADRSSASVEWSTPLSPDRSADWPAADGVASRLRNPADTDRSPADRRPHEPPPTRRSSVLEAFALVASTGGSRPAGRAAESLVFRPGRFGRWLARRRPLRPKPVVLRLAGAALPSPPGRGRFLASQPRSTCPNSSATSNIGRAGVSSSAPSSSLAAHILLFLLIVAMPSPTHDPRKGLLAAFLPPEKSEEKGADRLPRGPGPSANRRSPTCPTPIAARAEATARSRVPSPRSSPSARRRPAPGAR